MSLISFSKNGDVSEEEIRRGIDLDMGSGKTTPLIQTTNASPKLHQSNKLLSGFSSPLVPEETNYMDDIDECKSLESEEKCLIRRSMVAHTDYIYTQDIDGHP
ncbi:Phytosulfokines 1 [Morus notabilis]|uniref:Phytosulfokine n=1 Tax=Morus notabilis TaxID=981085 RepID=W9QNV8_9ROSA|nr:Phytosulfokines 1 [Morus notabilis]